MEEKKRRPRLIKPDSGFSLKERPKADRPEKENDSEGTFERNPTPEQEKPFERKPYDTDRSDNPDRNRDNEGSNFERRPFNPERRESGDGGGGFERKPYNREGDERKPYNNDRPPRPFNRDNNSGGGGYERKPYNKEGGDRRPYDNDRPRPFNPDRNSSGGGGYERKPYNKEGGDRRPYDNDRPRPFNPDRNSSGGSGGYERKPYNKEGGDRRPYDNDRPRPFNPDRNSSGGGGYERKPYNKEGGDRRPYDNDRPRYGDRSGGDNRFGGGGDRKPYNNRGGGGGGGFGKKPFGRKPFGRKDDFVIDRKPKPELPSGEGMPLNKYLAHCGISSRRKAVEFIENGEVTVNGEVKLEPYYRIQPNDAVVCQGNPVTIQERMVYVLLNKPKNVITTTDDERGRATVIDIVDSSFPERLYPVGRLDRDTTGLILLTNDGDLAQKLSHPSHAVMKQYRIGLDKPLTHADEKLIEAGLELEDGLMEVNWLRFSEDHPDRDVVEVEISSGRNRVIRRLFEALGYDVRKLDRFYFAGLTKKELPRGSFRELTQREIVMLKHFTGHPSTAKKHAESGAEEEATEPDTTVNEPVDDKPVE